MNPLISIIILTHNQSNVSRYCLPSLLNTAYSPLEFVLVDNNSSDDTAVFLKEFQQSVEQAGHSCKIHFSNANLGVASGRNLGLTLATGQYFSFLDNDILIRNRHWLSCILQTELESDVPAIIGGKLIYPEHPYLIQCACGGIDGRGRIFFHGRGAAWDDPAFQQKRDVQFATNFFLPRVIYDELGGFDNVYSPVQYEDIDYCYAAREKGYRVIYEPRAELYHIENRTTSGTKGLNNLYYLAKHARIFRKRWAHMFEEEEQSFPEDMLEWKRELISIDDLPVPPEQSFV